MVVRARTPGPIPHDWLTRNYSSDEVCYHDRCTCAVGSEMNRALIRSWCISLLETTPMQSSHLDNTSTDWTGMNTRVLQELRQVETPWGWDNWTIFNCFTARLKDLKEDLSAEKYKLPIGCYCFDFDSVVPCGPGSRARPQARMCGCISKHRQRCQTKSF